MRWYFQKTRVLYFLSVFFGLAILCMLFSTESITKNGNTVIRPLFPFSIVIPNEDAGRLIAGSLLLLWVLLCTIIANYYAGKKFVRLTEILVTDCDPHKYIQVLHSFLREKLPRNTNSTFLLMHLSWALLESGQNYEALKILSRISDFPNNKKGNKLRFSYYNNRFCCYNKMDDSQNSAKMLKNMKKLLDNASLSNKVKESYRKFYVKKENMFAFENGLDNHAEQIMTEAYQQAITELERVHAKFDLGRIYLYQKENVKAKNAFEYVIAHGNKLALVAQAKSYIENL